MLCKKIHKTDSLCESSFSATIRTSHNVDTVFLIKIERVCYYVDVFTINSLYSKFEIVQAISLENTL